VKHLEPGDQEQLTIEAMSTEAVTTSEIEGEMLDRASVQSSIRRQLGLAADKRRIGPAEQGIAEMMVDLYRNFAAALSSETLFAWHRMITHGRRDLKDIGRYRTEPTPMQVVSGAINRPDVHFEAPSLRDVPRQMARFIKWFNRTAHGGREPLPALTRAGLARHNVADSDQDVALQPCT
jgi:Fic family protein